MNPLINTLERNGKFDYLNTFRKTRNHVNIVLWFVYNITLPASIEYVIIHRGTNNLVHCP